MRKLALFEAQQFALLLMAGAPVTVACSYLLPRGAGEEDLRDAAECWPRQAEVLEELQVLTGGQPWQMLSKEERLKVALDKHYAEMAFFMWTHNYGELNGADRQKSDICRSALEAKIAGTAGTNNPLEAFYAEIIKQQKLAALPKIGRS